MELFAKIYFLSISISLLIYFVYNSRHSIIYLFGFNKKQGVVIDIQKVRSNSEIYFKYKIKSNEGNVFISINYITIPKIKIGDKCVFISLSNDAILVNSDIYQSISLVVLPLTIILFIVLQLFFVHNSNYLQPVRNPILILITLVIIISMIVYFMILRYKQRKHLLSQGIKVEGEIVKIENLSKEENCYSPKIQFMNKNGVKIMFTSMLRYYKINDIIIGNKVNVYYDNNFNEFAETEEYLNKYI